MLSPGIVIASLVSGSAPYPYEGWECDFPVRVHCLKTNECRSAEGSLSVVLSLGNSLYERCEGRFCEPHSPNFKVIGDLFVASAATAEDPVILVVADGLAATETKVTKEGVWISTGKCRKLDHDPMFNYNPPPGKEPPDGPGERGRPIG